MGGPKQRGNNPRLYAPLSIAMGDRLSGIRMDAGENVSDEVKEQCVVMTKYEGYIDKQLKQIDQFKKLENKKLPQEIDYLSIDGLRIEGLLLSSFVID